MNGPQVAGLADGKRLHLNHGPIDLIVEAFGREGEKRAACAQAVERFRTVLTELVQELAELRSPAAADARIFRGSIASRMEAAAAPFAPEFITPMAAVAGAVADEVLAAMTDNRELERAYVNNGGDIALHLAPGQEMRLAMAGSGDGLANRLMVDAGSPVRGVATSGWRGRSHSLGIADTVTVLAKNAAAADAAATMIANAVDLPGHRAIRREPAKDLAPDSDLGGRLVTVEVKALAPDEISEALARGLAAAEDYRRRGLIEAAGLFLAGEHRVCGALLKLDRSDADSEDTSSPVPFAHSVSPSSSKEQEWGASAVGDSSPPLAGERWRAKRAGEGAKNREQNRSRRKPETTDRARALRRGDNIAEAKLWDELKDRKLGGYKFVRQQPVGPYYADFMCRRRRLVVEVDGSQHAESQRDRRRDEYMRAQGISVIRFWNIDVLTRIDNLCETLLVALEGRYAEDVVATDLRFVSGRSRLK